MEKTTENTTITIKLEITSQQARLLPDDIDVYLEKAALEKLGEAIRLGSRCDAPMRAPF